MQGLAYRAGGNNSPETHTGGMPRDQEQRHQDPL